tara:strand:- start:3858 stop:4829 length:972 start_codon:yes stop_codon:yes gene_type:complete
MHYDSSKLNFLKRVFGPHEKSKDGVNYAFKCPNCGKQGSTKKKLVIKIDDGVYQCWVCDIKGKNLGYLIKKYRPSSFVEYQGTYRNSTRGSRNYDIMADEEQLLELPNGFRLLAVSNGIVDPDFAAVKKYATSRMIDERDLWYFKVGTCLKGRYRRRLIVPSFDEEGKLNYYVARTIDKDNPRKYLNPRVSKRDIIFNEININWNEELTLVEGPFDLMKCNENSSCILGSNFNKKYRLFKKIVENRTPVLLALDPDATKKMHDIAMLLSQYGVSVRVIHIKGHEDVGSMTKGEFLHLRKNAVSWSGNDRLMHIIGGIKSGSIL